jgi:hypothetical protein
MWDCNTLKNHGLFISAPEVTLSAVSNQQQTLRSSREAQRKRLNEEK